MVAIVNIGTSLSSSRAAVALAEKYDFIYAAVGVHPHDAKTVTPKVLAELRILARHPKVVAVGEIGLDYYRDLAPRDRQRNALERQLALAVEMDLPVVIHCRDAGPDLQWIIPSHHHVRKTNSQFANRGINTAITKIQQTRYAFPVNKDIFTVGITVDELMW